MDPKVTAYEVILRMQARKWDLPEGKYEKARCAARELKCDLQSYANDCADVNGIKAQLLREAADHAEKAQAAIDAIKFLAETGVI